MSLLTKAATKIGIGGSGGGGGGVMGVGGVGGGGGMGGGSGMGGGGGAGNEGNGVIGAGGGEGTPEIIEGGSPMHGSNSMHGGNPMHGGNSMHSGNPVHPTESGWIIEARQMQNRALMAEEAHMYDNQKMLMYLKQIGAKTRSNMNIADQMLAFCNSILKENSETQNKARRKAQELSDAIAETKFLRSDVKDALNEKAKMQAELDNMYRKYKDKTEKLDKADRKREEAVAKVMRQLHEQQASHEFDKRQSEAALRAQLGELQTEIHRLQGEHQAAFEALEMKHANDLKDVFTQHEAAQKTLNDSKEKEIDDVIDDYESQMNILKERTRELAADLISQTDDFRPATDQALRLKLLDLRNKIKNITVPNNLQLRPGGGGGGAPAQLSGAGDGKDASSALAVAGSALQQLPHDLDPTGFVARHGARDLQYILRGLVWNVLVEAFFAVPFGFGFLGSDAGRQQLLDIHRAWSRVYGGQQSSRSYSYETDELAVYRRDYNANKLRSAIFQSFLPVVFPEKVSRQQQQQGNHQQQDQQQQQQQQHQALTLQQLPQPQPALAQQLQQAQQQQYQAYQPGMHGGAPPPPPPPRRQLSPPVNNSYLGGGSSSGNGVADWHRQHCQAVTHAIQQLLDRITGYATRPDALEAVPAIVSQAAELGLECGVQRAQVELLVPQRGEIVQPGPEYEDCLGSSGTDGNGARRDLKVDLVVSPGLVRIGDGRGDISVRKALVPCEVFPQV